MNNDTVMYIAVFAAVVAVIALIMIWQVRSSLNQSAAPAPAAASKKAAPAAAPRAGDNGAVVAAIGGGEIVSIRPAARTGWTTGARIAGVSGNQQF